MQHAGAFVATVMVICRYVNSKVCENVHAREVMRKARHGAGQEDSLQSCTCMDFVCARPRGGLTGSKGNRNYSDHVRNTAVLAPLS